MDFFKILAMEKPNLPANSGVRLPIGYRFHPTDQELILHYLKRKVIGIPLPAYVIPEFDVFQAEPWGLPGDVKERRYFFSNRKGNENDKKCKRAAGSGYWKSIGKEKQIVVSQSKRAVGMRKTLMFCEGKNTHEPKTRWVMHEYRLVGIATIPNSTQIFQKELGDWVVYSIFEKKGKTKRQVISKPSNSNKNQTIGVITPDFMNFDNEDSSELGPPQPSPSCSGSSSGIAEASNDGLDQEESSGCGNSSFLSYSCMREQ